MLDLSGKGKLKIAICDDNPLMLEKLRMIVERTLSEQWDLEILWDTSPQRLLEMRSEFQIVVLDIQLPEENGVAFAQKIIAQNSDCRVIFVSGFLRYVSDVYDVPHLGMVLKDQLREQLPKFLLRAANEVSALEEETLTVTVKGEPQRLRVSNIYFMERKGHITLIRLKSGQQVQSREKLDALLSQVPACNLCRCHISYAVNLRWVESMGGREFVLAGGESIPISRANLQAAKTAFFRYLRETT